MIDAYLNHVHQGEMMISVFHKSEPSSQISKHLSTKEFKCQCHNQCDLNVIDTRLVGAFEATRADMGTGIRIQSGYRCTFHNLAVGGVERSYHTRGLAIDLWNGDMKKLEKVMKKHFDYVEMGRGEMYLHGHILP